MSRKFQRKIEDFVCENCDHHVKGNGYTNHCPKCLWSKHVDINPGDRKNCCQGLMRPSRAFFNSGRWKIVQICLKCNQEREFYAIEADDLDEILKLSVSSIKN